MPPAASRRAVLRLLLIAALYACTARVSMSAAVLDGTLGPVWLPAGVAVAAALGSGPAVWPALLAGAFVANVLGLAESAAAAGTALGATLAALAAAAVLRRMAVDPSVRRPGDVPRLVVVAVAAGLMSAAIGVVALCLQGALPWSGMPRAVAMWGMGDALGIVLVVPLWLARGRFDRAAALRLLTTTAGLGLLIFVVFGGPGAPLWLLAAPALFLAVREGIPGAVVAAGLLSGVAVWTTDAGTGPFAASSTGLLESQLFALMLTGALLAAGSVTEERDRMLARLRKMAEEDAALRRVATAVAGTGSLEEISARAGAEIARLLGLDAGVVVRYDGDEVEVLAHVSAEGFSAPAQGTRLPIAPGGAVDRVRRSGRPGRFDERGRPVLTMPPFRQRIAAPVHAEGAVWGALLAVSTSEADLPPDTEARLGRFAELVGIAITNVAARDDLLRQATTDPLTGLANHRAFHERLREAVATARRHATPLSVAVFDVDRFKQVNDTLGHVVGDAVLAEAARRLRGAARAGEVVARIGGDELALLMPGTGGADAHAAAERLRHTVSSAPFAGAGVLTLSAGVCDLDQASRAEDLLRLADGALYWGKAHGRDQTVLYLPEVVQELSAAERAERLERSQALAAVRALAEAIDAKDPATTRHSERVADLAGRLAEVAGWPHGRVARLRDAGLVHDVGKIGVPDAILSKPGRLTDEEYAVVQRHAELGARIAGEVLDAEQVAWVRGHHERHDGRGYPDGLAGEAITEGARLMALADAWDAMTGARVYSEPMPYEEALAECRRQSGRQFAPEAVAALERLAASGALRAPVAMPA